MIVGSLYYIQTESFSKFVTQTARTYLKGTQFEAVQFDRIKLSAFPPVLEVQNISASYSDENRDLEVILDSISLNFIPDEIFTKKITFSHLQLVRGSIAIKEKQENIKVQKVDDQSVSLERVMNFIKERIPIRFAAIGIYETDINYNEKYLAYINQLTVYRGLDNLEISLDSQSFKILSYTNLKISDISTEIIVDEEQLFAKKLTLKLNDQPLSIKGKLINPFQDSSREFSLDMKGSVDLVTLNSFPEIKNIGMFERGVINIDGQLEQKKELVGQIKISGTNVLSDFIKADKIEALVIYKKAGIYIHEANIREGTGSVDLLQPFELYSFEKKSFVDDVVDVEARAFPLRSAVRFIRDILSPLDAQINGKISFSLLSANHFEFKAGDQARLDEVKLTVKDEQKKDFKIIDVEWIEVSGMLFVYKNNTFYIEGEGHAPKSIFQVQGSANSKGLSFNMPQARVNIADLGKIAGLNLTGSGIFDISIKGSTQTDVVLNIKGEGEDLVFEGNDLGSGLFDINYYFNKSLLEIVRGDGAIDSYDYNFTGTINLANDELDLIFKTQDIGFSSVKKLAREFVFSQIPLSLDFITGRITGEIIIGGTLDSIDIDGNITDADFWIAGEYIRKVKSTFTKRGSLVKVTNSGGRMGGGRVGINGAYVMGDSLFDKFTIALNDIEMSQLSYFTDPRLRFLARLDGVLNFNIENNKQVGDVKLKISNVSTQSQKFPNSHLTAQMSDEVLNFKSDLLGIINSLGKIHLNDKMRSSIQIKALSENFENLFSFVGVDPQVVALKGDIDGELNASFWVKKKASLSLIADLKAFSLVKEDFEVKAATLGRVVEIQEDKIEKLNLKFLGNETDISIFGTGQIGKTYNIENKGFLNAKLLELFRDYWILSEGHLNWDMNIGKNELEDNFHHRAKIWSDDWFVSFVDMPIAPKKIIFNIVEDNSLMIISDTQIITQTGKVDLSGNILWSDIYPTINLTAKLSNVRINLARDSYLAMNGKLDLSGHDFPLLLEGKLNIMEGFIREGYIASMMDEEDSVEHPLIYLPESSYDKEVAVLEMGIEVATAKPIKLKNSWIDLPLKANLRIEGSEKKPIIDGKIESIASQGKFNFKDNFYVIKNGFVSFSSSTNYKNPNLNIEAESEISDYLVNARVIGPLDKYNVLLTSSPPLESEDIFSLITFGYLQTSTQTVSQKSQENLTSLGVGSLLLDQLKIRDMLRDNLGLVLSVRSEEFESNAGFLNSKSGGESIVDGRTQTSTRIQISKQISKKIEMSMERDLTTNYQGLNFNYSLDKDVAVKGIIEQRNNLGVAEGANNYIGVGVDVNLNWTFK